MATGSARKYRDDPFFRTEVTILVLQGAFAIFLLVVLGAIATELYHDALMAVADGLNAALLPGANPSTISASIVSDLSRLSSRTVILAALGVVAITALFTYVITKVALSPTRQALQSQKRFIGNVAHELRTPLSIIKTNTEVRLLDPDISESSLRLHHATLEELDRISDIINNLLSLSSSVRPERMDFREVDLGAVIENVMRSLERLAIPKHLRITQRLSGRRAVIGNPAALEQIVMNIIKNAVLYTPSGGRVLVTVDPVYPDLIEFSVRDSGIGIARNDLFHIFEPFYRTDPSRQRHGAGSGLGLTIVAELVKLHDGKITVRSAINRGTTVTVLLPAAASSRDKGGAERSRDNMSEIEVDFSKLT